MVRVDRVFLAAFFVKVHPPTFPALEVVLDVHRDCRTRPREMPESALRGSEEP